jgi:hypothetical protein
MTAPTAYVNKDDRLLRQEILGSRRLSNYWWAIVILLGSTGFLLSSVSSYLQVNLLPFANPTELIFVPQGLVMGLYGSAGLLLSLYLWLVILWNVGGGYNEFSRETGMARVFRWGFPGENRQVEITCPLEDVQAIRVGIKEGINPQRALYLKIKGKGEVPLTRVGQPLALSVLENQGAELARFMGVPLEGL